MVEIPSKDLIVKHVGTTRSCQFSEQDFADCRWWVPLSTAAMTAVKLKNNGRESFPETVQYSNKFDYFNCGSPFSWLQSSRDSEMQLVENSSELT